MDGEQAFLEALNYVSSHMRADIYRVNQLLHGPLPWLDDVEKLDGLAESSFSVPDELVRAVLVTGTLFFELDGCPTTRQGTIFCEGSILCTSTQPRKLIGRILAEIPGAEFQIDHQGPLSLVGEDNGCHLCGYCTIAKRYHSRSIVSTKLSQFKSAIRNRRRDWEAFLNPFKISWTSSKRRVPLAVRITGLMPGRRRDDASVTGGPRGGSHSPNLPLGKRGGVCKPL
jgi:hypothetical protein